ncbi:MAG: class I SAM-dependent methyltransferase [Dechloromonas sp.]|nr:MAG: class I SAM-dependent methyltransferase [Dechloromonas sp.]
MNSPEKFYAGLSQFYHLIYPDWDESIRRQASHLDSVIRECWGPNCRSVLDASCGIGTQALGLAALGYEVTGSDLSSEEIERAKMEAATRGLAIDFHVCDMRHVFDRFSRQFDVVISCDNSLPHLLTDEEISEALLQFLQCTRPGGGCIVTLRDYAKEDVTKRQTKPYGLRELSGRRWSLSQVWEPSGEYYDVSMYLVEGQGGADSRTHVFRTRYYPILINRLMGLMREVGFQGVERLDGRFFQPMIVGTKPGPAI